MTRRILPALALLALVLTAQATPAVHRTGTLSEIPTDLHAFLLRANEPVTHTFSRTPAFTWKAVNLTGGHYQFQLATSRNFEDSTLVFKDANVSQPAETVTAPAALADRRALRALGARALDGEQRHERHPVEQALRVQRPVGDRRHSSADPRA